MPGHGSFWNRRKGLRWQHGRSLHDSQGQWDSKSARVDVGGNLRRLRMARRISIRGLAERSGLAVNTLCLIENGKSSPSVSTLQQLAYSLGIPVLAFFDDLEPSCQVILTKSGNRNKTNVECGYLEDLATGSTFSVMAPFVITLEPSMGSGSEDIVHAGYEFIYCLKGNLIYTIDGERFNISVGDSLMFAAHLPHQWHNETTEVAQYILVFSSEEVVPVFNDYFLDHVE